MQTLTERNAIHSASISAADQRLFLAGANFLSTWNFRSGQLTARSNAPACVSSLCLVSDSAVVYAALKDAKGAVVKCSAETLKPLRRLDGHKDDVTAMIAAPQGLLVTAAKDGQVLLWKTESDQLIGRVVAGEKPITALGCLNQSGFVSVGEDNRLVLWDWNLVAQKELTLPENVTSLCVSKDNSRIFLGGATQLFIVATENWEVTASAKPHSAAITSIAEHDSGEFVITGSADKSVAVTSVAAPDINQLLGQHGDIVSSVLVVDETIVSSSLDKTVAFWPLSSAFEVLFKHLASRSLRSTSPVALTFIQPEEEETVQVIVFSNGSAVGLSRGGRIVKEAADVSVVFNGREKVIIGVDEQGDLIADNGEVFRLDYDAKCIELKTVLALF